MRMKAGFTATISIVICFAGISCQKQTRTTAGAAQASQPANPSGMSNVPPLTLDGSKTTGSPATTSTEQTSAPMPFSPPPRRAESSSNGNGGVPLAFANAQPEDAAPRVPIGAVEQLMAKNDVVVVDVRDAADYEAEHAKGAINIPLSDITRDIDKLPHDKMIVAYCT